jgi:hypothetical protein
MAAASSRRSRAAGTGWSLPGTPAATIAASRTASPAHTASATAAPRTPQRRTTSWMSGYPHALSPRTTLPAARLIACNPCHRPGSSCPICIGASSPRPVMHRTFFSLMPGHDPRLSGGPQAAHASGQALHRPEAEQARIQPRPAEGWGPLRPGQAAGCRLPDQARARRCAGPGASFRPTQEQARAGPGLRAPGAGGASFHQGVRTPTDHASGSAGPARTRRFAAGSATLPSSLEPGFDQCHRTDVPRRRMRR